MIEKIPVFAPNIDDSTLQAVKGAFDNVWLGMGNITQEFEEKISAFLNLKDRYVCACNTGTSALHLALRCAGVEPGDEVITPSFNYVADHQAVRMCGAEVVLCDIESNNLGIDCNKAETLISNKTKAIIPLHFAGIPCNQQAVYELAEKYGLRVIEDGMHAFGTEINGQKIGSYGDICCFSFDPVKIITSIDGGCVVVNSEEALEQCRRMRFLGVDKETQFRYKNKRAWEYDVVSDGYRYHLNNIMASIGVSQIKQIENFIRSRQDVCQAYVSAFETIDDIQLLTHDYSFISPFIFSMRVAASKRAKLIEHLQSQQIDVGIHFIPVHKHDAFSAVRKSDMSTTENVVEEVITLPLHSNMNTEFVDRITTSVQQYFS